MFTSSLCRRLATWWPRLAEKAGPAPWFGRHLAARIPMNPGTWPRENGRSLPSISEWSSMIFKGEFRISYYHQEPVLTLRRKEWSILYWYLKFRQLQIVKKTFTPDIMNGFESEVPKIELLFMDYINFPTDCFSYYCYNKNCFPLESVG